MFTYFNSIRIGTILVTYYDAARNKAFWLSDPENWINVSTKIDAGWDTGIAAFVKKVGMTDEEFYEFLKKLERLPEQKEDFLKNVFEPVFVRPFMKALFGNEAA